MVMPSVRTLLICRPLNHARYHHNLAPSPQVWVLLSAVVKLMARGATLESRLDNMVANISSMAASQDKTEATLATLVEAQQATISAVTSLTEMLDVFTSRCEE